VRLRAALLALSTGLAGLAPSAFAGDSLYVVEQVVVSLNSQADGSGERVAALKSGDRVELIERAGEEVHVRLPDGKEGWVRAIYVSGDEPMRPRLAQSEAQVARLQAEVSRLEAQVAATAGIGHPAEAAPAAPEEPAAPASTLFGVPSESAPRRVWVWVSLTAIAALGAGFALGWRTLDRRIRMKYGGLKIY
jgi:hypothetical protein